MKKLTLVIALLVLCMSLVACSGSKEPAPVATTGTTTETTTEVTAANDGSSYGIDLTAEGMQKMAEEYATAIP